MSVWVITTGCVAQHSRDLFINKPCCGSTGISRWMNPKPTYWVCKYCMGNFSKFPTCPPFSRLLSDYSQISLSDSTIEFSPCSSPILLKFCILLFKLLLAEIWNNKNNGLKEWYLNYVWKFLFRLLLLHIKSASKKIWHLAQGRVVDLCLWPYICISTYKH